MVEEPTVEQTITMLRGIKARYELHHSVSISDSALVTAATYSNRYIPDRHLPVRILTLWAREMELIHLFDCRTRR